MSVAESSLRNVLNTEYKRSVLLVEDDESNRNTISDILVEFGGFYVVAVEGYEQAISELQKNRYDVVLSDNRMHGKTGVEVLNKIYELYGLETPVGFVMISGDPPALPEYELIDIITKASDPQRTIDAVVEMAKKVERIKHVYEQAA